MPKMIFMGTNDPYWPVDAVKNYIDSIPGDNHICYTPNAGHDLGDKYTAFSGLSALIGLTVTGRDIPVCRYSINRSGRTASIDLGTTPELLTGAVIWSADSKDQDFRDEKWSSREIRIDNKAAVSVSIELPASGFRAFYVDLKYKAPYGGDFTQSTRMFVSDSNELLIRK
jgi:PhoPQ-activated pathogenicity-related protein